MSKEIIFTEDELDCLSEIINISYGVSTAVISDMLNSFATLKVPEIKIISSNLLKPHLFNIVDTNEEQFVVTQHLIGDISGENLFLINKTSAINISREFEKNTDDTYTDDIIFDILLEIINILSSMALRELSKSLNLAVSVEPPSIEKINSITNFGSYFIEEYQQIIVISSNLEFKDQKIEAIFMLLTKDESIKLIQNSIKNILDEL